MDELGVWSWLKRQFRGNEEDTPDERQSAMVSLQQLNERRTREQQKRMDGEQEPLAQPEDPRVLDERRIVSVFRKPYASELESSRLNNRLISAERFAYLGMGLSTALLAGSIVLYTAVTGI